MNKINNNEKAIEALVQLYQCDICPQRDDEKIRLYLLLAQLLDSTPERLLKECSTSYLCGVMSRASCLVNRINPENITPTDAMGTLLFGKYMHDQYFPKLKQTKPWWKKFRI